MKTDQKFVPRSGEQPINVSYITWQYILPEPLAASASVPWAVPRYQEPAHCHEIRSGSAGKLNVDFLAHANHPCNFLARNIELPATLDAVLPGQTDLQLPQPGAAAQEQHNL